MKKVKCGKEESKVEDICIELISGEIEGQILGKRYQVREFLDKGRSGTVYKVDDTK